MPECGNQLEPMRLAFQVCQYCMKPLGLSSVRETGDKGYVGKVAVVLVVGDGGARRQQYCTTYCMIHDGLARWRRGGKEACRSSLG